MIHHSLIVLAIVSAITGKVIEEDTQQPAIQAVVQLLSERDSTQCDVTVTNLDGIFTIKAVPGDYILKFSSVGYNDQFRNIHLTSSQTGFNIGTVSLPIEAQILSEAVVTAKVEPITVQEDTVIYNAAALRVPEDAMLGDLLKKIPGLQIQGNTVTLHGKEVNQLLVNGKRFFGGNVKTGLKNLPADMVENIRAYERQTDEALISGIEDGETEPVLDLTVKEKMLGAWRGTATAGGGTESRLNARVNASNIDKKKQTTVLLGIDNLPETSAFSNTTRSQMGSGSTGDRGSVEAGFNYAKSTEKYDIGGHIRYDGNKSNVMAEGYSESITATKSSYNSSSTPRESYVHNAKGDLTFQWRIKNDLTLYIKPTVAFNWNDALSDPTSRTYNAPEMDSCINESSNKTRYFNSTLSADYSVQLTKKLASKKGRTLNFQVGQSFKNAGTDQFNDYHTYFRTKSTESHRKQYVDSDNRTSTINVAVGYTEPLGKSRYLNFNIKGDFRKQTTQRGLYSFTKMFPDWNVIYDHNLKHNLDALPTGWEETLDKDVSYTGTYHYNALVAYGAYRISKKRIYLSAGMTFRAQWTRIDYVTAAIPDGQEKNFIFNFAPSINFKYTKNKNKQLSCHYRSWPGTPSMYDMLPVNSGTSPTYVHSGNPNLKPSFTHNADVSYNYSNIKKQNSLVSSLAVWYYQNSISNVSEYDHETGIRSVIPRNIQGNWRTKASVGVTQTFRNKNFSLADNATAEYGNTNSYLYNSSKKDSELNSTRRFIVKNSLELCYRNNWLEVELNQGTEFTDERYSLKPDMHQAPLNLSAGLSATAILPWRMRMTASYTLLHQQGYMISELNRNYNILNAQITQPLFKGRAVLRLEGFDLLHQLTNMTRSFSSSSRSVTTYNGVTRYVLLSFVYKFGKK